MTCGLNGENVQVAFAELEKAKFDRFVGGLLLKDGFLNFQTEKSKNSIGRSIWNAWGDALEDTDYNKPWRDNGKAHKYYLYSITTGKTQKI
jgi:hypothetical protein